MLAATFLQLVDVTTFLALRDHLEFLVLQKRTYGIGQMLNMKYLDATLEQFSAVVEEWFLM